VSQIGAGAAVILVQGLDIREWLLHLSDAMQV